MISYFFRQLFQNPTFPKGMKNLRRDFPSHRFTLATARNKACVVENRCNNSNRILNKSRRRGNRKAFSVVLRVSGSAFNAKELTDKFHRFAQCNRRRASMDNNLECSFRTQHFTSSSLSAFFSSSG